MGPKGMPVPERAGGITPLWEGLGFLVMRTGLSVDQSGDLSFLITRRPLSSAETSFARTRCHYRSTSRLKSMTFRDLFIAFSTRLCFPIQQRERLFYSVNTGYL